MRANNRRRNCFAALLVGVAAFAAARSRAADPLPLWNDTAAVAPAGEDGVTAQTTTARAQQEARPQSLTADEYREPGRIAPMSFRLASARADGPADQTAQVHEPQANEARTAEISTEVGKGDQATDLALKLQNPVADLISIPFQFNWDTGMGKNDANRLLLNIQPVIPFSLNKDWNVISRTILPVVWQESLGEGISSDFGLGDVLQSFFFSPKEPIGGWILGFGPAMQIPTGTSDLFRTKQFSLGPTGVALRQEHGWTYGILANHLWHLCGSDDVPDVNATFLQPFLVYTFPSATSIGVNSETTYDWSAEQWTVPINAFVAQVVKFGKLPVQFQFGGRYYVEAADGGPDWGLRFAVTFLLPK